MNKQYSKIIFCIILGLLIAGMAPGFCNEVNTVDTSNLEENSTINIEAPVQPVEFNTVYIKDIEILGNTVDGVSVGILQDDGQYKITLFTNNGLDNMSPDYREDKEELLLPCQLEKIGDSTDRLYYDKEEKAWCIYKVSQSKIVLPITFTISLTMHIDCHIALLFAGDVGIFSTSSYLTFLFSCGSSALIFSKNP